MESSALYHTAIWSLLKKSFKSVYILTAIFYEEV